MGPVLMGVREAADFTGYSVRYLYKLTSEKRIPHYKPQGGKVFFKPSELVAFMSRGRVLADYEVEDQAERHLLGGQG